MRQCTHVCYLYEVICCHMRTHRRAEPELANVLRTERISNGYVEADD